MSVRIEHMFCLFDWNHISSSLLLAVFPQASGSSVAKEPDEVVLNPVYLL